MLHNYVCCGLSVKYTELCTYMNIYMHIAYAAHKCLCIILCKEMTSLVIFLNC